MKKKSTVKAFKTAKEMDDYLDNQDLGAVFETQSRKVIPKTKKVNLDLPSNMLTQIDLIAEKIGVARQPLLKMWIHEKLKEENGLSA